MKLGAKEYKVLLKFSILGFAFIYAAYTRLFPPDIAIDAEIIAQDQLETSKVISYQSESDYVKLLLVIDGISKTSNNFISRKNYYLNRTLEFTCNNEVLKTQLDNAKFVIFDLLANQYSNSQFANIRITLDDCINGI